MNQTIFFKHLAKRQGIYLFLFIGIIFFSIRCCPVGYVTDYLNLGGQIAPYSIVEIIIATLGSILGIVLALVLIAFEMYRNRFGKEGIRRFLSNPYTIFLVTLQVSVLSYSFIFLMMQGKSIPAGELASIYFLSFLFLCSIILMLPMGKKIISDADSYRHIKNETNKITGKAIGDTVGYQHGRLEYANQLEKLDSSPFLMLRNLGIKYAQEKNEYIPAYIIQETTRKFIPFISSEIDRRVLTEGYNALFITWSGIVNESIKNDGYLALKQIWNSIEEIHSHHIKNSILLIRTETLMDFIKDFIEQLLKNNLDEIVLDGLFTIERIFEKHLVKSLPKQELISNIAYIFELEVKPRHDTDVEIQWQYISQDIPRIIYTAIDKAIYYKKERIIHSGLLTLEGFIRDSISKGIGNYQEQLLVVSLFGDIIYLNTIGIKQGVIDNYDLTNVMSTTTFNDILERRQSYSRILIREFLEYVKDLYRFKKLNLVNQYRPFFANVFRVIAQLHQKGDDFGTIICDILDAIEWFRVRLEKKLTIGKNAQNYLALEKCLLDLMEYHKTTRELGKDTTGWVKKEENKISFELLDSIEKAKSKFIKLDEAKRIVVQDK